MISKWEKVDKATDRMKVPGGWIVCTEAGVATGGVHQIFIVDKEHSWILGNEKTKSNSLKGFY